MRERFLDFNPVWLKILENPKLKLSLCESFWEVPCQSVRENVFSLETQLFGTSFLLFRQNTLGSPLLSAYIFNIIVSSLPFTNCISKEMRMGFLPPLAHLCNKVQGTCLFKEHQIWKSQLGCVSLILLVTPVVLQCTLFAEPRVG